MIEFAQDECFALSDILTRRLCRPDLQLNFRVAIEATGKNKAKFYAYLKLYKKPDFKLLYSAERNKEINIKELKKPSIVDEMSKSMYDEIFNKLKERIKSG